MSTDLERARATLYAAPPAKFVEARTELAKQLAAGGAKALAKDVKAIHKPVLGVWAVNRLAHVAPTLLQEFLEAATNLLALQRLPGRDVGAFREASARLRATKLAVVAAALDAAKEAGEGASDALERKVTELVDGISTDPEAQRLVLLGAFTGETADPFAALLAAGPAPVVEQAKPVAKPVVVPTLVSQAANVDVEQSRAREAQRLEEEKRRLEAERLREAERRRAEERRRRRDELDAALRSAEERASALDAQATEAEERARSARARADEARAESDRARKNLEAFDGEET